MLPEEPATENGTENGSTKPPTVVVQQQQDVASEAEDGQDHEDGGDEPTHTDEEDNDGIYPIILTLTGDFFEGVPLDTKVFLRLYTVLKLRKSTRHTHE